MSKHGRGSPGSFREHIDDLLERFRHHDDAGKSWPDKHREGATPKPSRTSDVHQSLFERAWRSR